MENLNNYKLYYQVYSSEIAQNINEYTSGFQGILLTEKSVNDFAYIQNQYTDKISSKLKKFGTNKNDSYKSSEWVSGRYVDYEYLYEENIVVWLGTSDYIYQKSGRIVSIKDLILLSKGIHSEKEDNKRTWYKSKQKRRKYARGKRCTYKRHSYAKNISKNALNIIDNFEEYPILKSKTHKEIRDYSYQCSWDFLDCSRGYRGNGWKDNSKFKKQYMKNIKD